MKKALTYLILVLFLFNSMGYYFLFEFQKYMAMKEMHSMMQQEGARISVVNIMNAEQDREFHRTDQNEFWYKGVMYDIKREIKTGRQTIFICIPDTKESKLFAGLKRVHQNKLQYAMWDHLNMIFLSLRAIDLSTSFAGKLVFPVLEISFKSILLSTWSPPPEIS